jgi:ketosteroid isomerase-like protein
VLAGMMELEEMRFVERATAYVTADGELALTIGRWEAMSKDADGNMVKIGGKDVEVVRRQPDGSWKFVIDHPMGGN